MKEKLKFIGILILFFFGFILIYLNLNQDLNNIKEIGQVQYFSSIEIDSGSITSYYIFEKNNELYYRQNIRQITINGQTEEKNQKVKKIKNVDELKKEIEKRKKTDEEFFYQKIVIKYIINNKEIDENEFWNKIDKIKNKIPILSLDIFIL